MIYDFTLKNNVKDLTSEVIDIKLGLIIDFNDAISGYIYYKRLTDDAIKSINM